MLAPQAQDLCLRTVRHVDQFFKPPTITDSTVDAAENEAVVTHLATATTKFSIVNRGSDQNRLNEIHIKGKGTKTTYESICVTDRYVREIFHLYKIRASYLHKQHVATVVRTPVNRERLFLHHPAAQGLQINVVTMLQTQTTSPHKYVHTVSSYIHLFPCKNAPAKTC